MTDYRVANELVVLNKTFMRIADALEKIAADAEPITNQPKLSTYHDREYQAYLQKKNQGYEWTKRNGDDGWGH